MDNAQLNGAISTLTNMLSTDEGKQNLQSMMNNMFGNSSQNGGNDCCECSNNNFDMSNLMQMVPNIMNSPIGNFGINMIAKLQSSYAKVQCDTEETATFFRTLSPYLSKRRYKSVEHAIKIMQLSHLPKIMNNFQ